MLDRFNTSAQNQQRIKLQSGSQGIFKGFLERLYSNNNKSQEGRKLPKYSSSPRIKHKRSRGRKKKSAVKDHSSGAKRAGNKSGYEFQTDPNGSIFANHELSRFTADKGGFQNSSRQKSTNRQEGVDFESLEAKKLNHKYQTFQNQFKERMNQRSSFGSQNKGRKGVLPLLLKFKQNGKTVDLSQTPVRRVQTVKQEPADNFREKAFDSQNYMNAQQNQDIQGIQGESIIDSGFENDKISEVVKETMTYFLPDGENTTKVHFIKFFRRSQLRNQQRPSLGN